MASMGKAPPPLRSRPPPDPPQCTIPPGTFESLHSTEPSEPPDPPDAICIPVLILLVDESHNYSPQVVDLESPASAMVFGSTSGVFPGVSISTKLSSMVRSTIPPFSIVGDFSTFRIIFVDMSGLMWLLTVPKPPSLQHAALRRLEDWILNADTLVSSKLRVGDAALVVTGNTILVNWSSFPVIYRSYLCERSFPVLYRVNRVLVVNVLMDSVSCGYILMSPCGFHSPIEWSLHTGFFYSVIEGLLTSWFQICLISSRVEHLPVNYRFSTRLKDRSTDDSFSVLFKDSTSWCHIFSAILSVVEMRGRLYNVDAAWDAKFMHRNIGGIFSGENTIILPNLCESRNYVLSALMAEAIAVCLAVITTVYSNVRSLGVSSDSLSLIKLLKNGGFQSNLFGIMFDIYHYLSYYDVIFSIFLFQNFNGEADAVAKSVLSLVIIIPQLGV